MTISPMIRFSALVLAGLGTIILPAAFAQTAAAPRLGPPVKLQADAATDPLGVEAEHPTLRWQLAALAPDDRGVAETAYQILVASSEEEIRNHHGDVWDSAKVAAPGQFSAPYAGRPLSSNTTYYWAARAWDQGDQPSEWSAPAHWTMGLAPADWKAKWIAATPDKPQHRPALESTRPTLDHAATLPIFRDDFTLAKPVKEARVYVCGLGQYELHVNGRTVSDAVLAPAWTDYAKTVPYNSYDVTAMLKPGPNAFGVLLGNGMYNVEGVRGRYTKFVGSFGQPKLILQLEVQFSDGTHTTIVSDRSWKSHPSPITFSSTYGGEDYDARLEQAGWDQPNFEGDGWESALEVQGPGGVLASDQTTPIRVLHIFPGLRLRQPKPGVLVFDLLQNVAGFPLLGVQGPAGARVTITAGELVSETGYVTQKSANASIDNPNQFSYTLKGKGPERWRPRFSYYGFRYLQVEKVTDNSADVAQTPFLERVDGLFVHAAAPVTGKFSSSDPQLGHIHDLIDKAILSNMMSVLTDCPHREKLGWLEQTHLNAGSIMYNYDVQRLYEKMAHDMQDSQLPDGLVPEIAPEYVAFVDTKGANTAFRDSPEWGSASILSPWAAYQFYGDRSILERSYLVMQRYAAYLRGKAKAHMLSFGLGDWYDIGPKPPGVSQLTGQGLTATATYYQDLTALVRIAEILGKQDDARAYAREAEEVKAAFNAALFHPGTNQYDRGSQTANAMPLVLGLVPEGHRDAVLANLVHDIQSRQNHVTAGDVGFHYVVRALTDAGRSDVLYDMLSRNDSPSYGYQLSRRATTLTEAWDTNPNSSQNHFMLGHAEEWFYRGLAGIRVDMSKTAPEQIVIAPAFVAQLQSASASFDSVLGAVGSAWKRAPGAVDLEVTIPAGTRATIVLPVKTPTQVSLEGASLQDSKLANHVGSSDGQLRCEIGSGHYHFHITE